MATVPTSPNTRPVTADAERHWHLVGLPHTIRGFERALAVPVAGAAWRAHVGEHLVGLRRAFIDHVVATEGPDGLYAELLEHAPRLARGVEVLARDHAELLAAMDRLHARLRGAAGELDDEQIRCSARTLLVQLWRHRQRGADLVYEAFETDIGGET